MHDLAERDTFELSFAACTCIDVLITVFSL